MSRPRLLDYLNDSMMRTLVVASLPLMASMAVSTLNTLIDGYWVSHLGENAIGAISMYIPIMYLFAALMEGIYVVTQVGTAITKGRGAAEELPRVVNTAYKYGYAIWGVFALAVFLLLDPIGRSMAAGGEVLTKFKAYTTVLLITNGFSLFNTISMATLTSIGDVKMPLWSSGVAVVSNLLLTPLFVFVFDWGIRGAALSTLVSVLINAGLLTVRFRRIGGLHNFSAPNRISHPIIRDLGKSIGIPIYFAFLVMSLSTWAYNAMMGPFGPVALAGLGIGYRYHMLMVLPSLAVASAMRAVMGQNLGAGHFQRVHLAYRSALRLVVVIYLVLCAVVWLLAPALSAIMDSGNLAIRAYSVYFLRCIALTYTLLACGVIAIATLETAGHGIMSLAMYLGAYVLLSVVPGYVLVRIWDPKGLFIAIALGPCWHLLSMWLANRVLHQRFPPGAAVQPLPRGAHT